MGESHQLPQVSDSVQPSRAACSLLAEPLVYVVGLVIGRVEASSAECGGLLHGGVVATPPVLDGEERISPAMSLFAEKDCV